MDQGPGLVLARGGRFAVNCGVVGKPDHDGDPAVHYALVDPPAKVPPSIAIRRSPHRIAPTQRRGSSTRLRTPSPLRLRNLSSPRGAFWRPNGSRSAGTRPS